MFAISVNSINLPQNYNRHACALKRAAIILCAQSSMDPKLDCTCARRPSTSEALREIEAAMRGIEAAESPRAAAAAAAQLRTYDNSFWEPDSRPAQVRHPAPSIVTFAEYVNKG